MLTNYQSTNKKWRAEAQKAHEVCGKINYRGGEETKTGRRRKEGLGGDKRRGLGEEEKNEDRKNN